MFDVWVCEPCQEVMHWPCIETNANAECRRFGLGLTRIRAVGTFRMRQRVGLPACPMSVPRTLPRHRPCAGAFFCVCELSCPLGHHLTQCKMPSGLRGCVITNPSFLRTSQRSGGALWPWLRAKAPSSGSTHRFFEIGPRKATEQD
jgi:hypothetical protein